MNPRLSRMAGDFTTLADVLKIVLSGHGWQNVGVLCPNSDTASEFVGLLSLSDRSSLKLTLQTFSNNTIAQSVRQLKTFSIFVLIASSRADVEVITQEARFAGLLGPGFAWIVVPVVGSCELSSLASTYLEGARILRPVCVSSSTSPAFQSPFDAMAFDATATAILHSVPNPSFFSLTFPEFGLRSVFLQANFTSSFTGATGTIGLTGQGNGGVLAADCFALYRLDGSGGEKMVAKVKT